MKERGQVGSEQPLTAPPATTMWFSSVRITSLSPSRWWALPPTRIAYFSRPRSPKVVLRVHAIRAKRQQDCQRQ